jgi:hypothetical protein
MIRRTILVRSIRPGSPAATAFGVRGGWIGA